MESFLKDSLMHLDAIFSLVPHDAILYGKCEVFLNSTLAAIGNINLLYKGSKGYYYRTEYKKIDLVRLEQQTGKVLFLLESKFFYMSDFDIKCSRKLLTQIAFPKNVERPNHVEAIISKAIYQLQDYKQKLTNNGQMCSEIAIDCAILLSFLYFPYGTNGYTEDKSGLKYVNEIRLNFDKALFKKNNFEINRLVDYIVHSFIERSLVITHPYNAITLKIKYKKSLKLRSKLGFDFFIIFIALTI